MGGDCARCGQRQATVLTNTVISKTFTAFDEWADPRRRGLCTICSWAYTGCGLRSQPHLITRDPATLQPLSPTEVGRLLSQGPLACDRCLIVPIRAGRKHLAPLAAWGRIRVDSASLPWREEDAQRLRIVLTLRRQGFGSRMLAAAAPPYVVLKKLPPTTWGSVVDAWREIDPWRIADSPWLPLALHVTTPTRSQGDAR